MKEKALPPWPDFRGQNKANLIQRREEARVGALVFVYDENHRVYRGSGFSSGSALERYHFIITRIESETRVSWILDRYGQKIPKKDPRAMYGAADVEDAIWQRVHSWRIADQLKRVDAATLRKIAELIGYTATDIE